MKKIVFCLLLLVSCTDKDKPPAGILSKDQMINILIDLHVAEAKANMVNLQSQDSTRIYYKSLEYDVFDKYRVDSTIYHSSYLYYMEHIATMDEIYAAVVDSLSLRENSIKAPNRTTEIVR